MSAQFTTIAGELPPGARCIGRIEVLGLAIYAVDRSPGGGANRWLVVDALGRVTPASAAHLLALARMQVQALDALVHHEERALPRFEPVCQPDGLSPGRWA